jgi:hypothetical protein
MKELGYAKISFSKTWFQEYSAQFFAGNVAKTMPCLPSPSHHHFYRWYVYHSQSWVVYYCFNHMIDHAPFDVTPFVEETNPPGHFLIHWAPKTWYRRSPRDHPVPIATFFGQ